MDRNYLKHREGDRTNVVLAAAGFNFDLLLRWFARFFCGFVGMADLCLKSGFFTGD